MSLSKILIVHTWGIGDWLMFSPVILGIHRQYPDAKIDVISGNIGAGKLIEILSGVHLIGNFDIKRGVLRFLWQSIRVAEGPYDLLIFTGGLSSLKATMLAPFIRSTKKICLKTHFGPHPFLSPSLPYDQAKHRLENNLKFLQILKIPKVDEAYYFPVAMHKLKQKGVARFKDDSAVSLEAELGLEEYPFLYSDQGESCWRKIRRGKARGRVLIHPGSDSQSSYKRWPPKSYIGVIEKLLARSIPVTLLVGPNETELLPAFSNINSKHFSIVKELSMLELLNVLSENEIFLNNDSGVGHLAAAVGMSLISLFGPADPTHARPIAKNIEVILSVDDLSCRPCMVQGGAYGCQSPVCVTDISADRVINSVLKKLSEPVPVPQGTADKPQGII